MPFNASSSYLPFVRISGVITRVGFCCSVFFCSISLMLTLFGVKKKLGNYAYLIVTFSTVSILLALTEFILHPNAHSYNVGYFFYTTSRPFGLNRNAVELCLAIYTGIYASTITTLSVQFIYRYWAVFQTEKLRMFQGYWWFAWIAYSTVFGAEWALGIYFLDKSDDYAKNYLRDVMEEKYDMNIDEVAGFAVLAYGADGLLRYKNLICLSNMMCIMVVLYSIIIYCAMMMYLNMEEKLQILSDSMRRLHRQIYWTLILQVSLPSIFLFIPVILIIYSPLLNAELDVPTGSALCSMSLYPALDALIMMYVVTDYRVIIKKAFNTISSGWKANAKQAATVSKGGACRVQRNRGGIIQTN